MTIKILIGDVFEQLALLPDESVHCVVTSPPYWGLRDYGVDGQIGMEPTLAEHLDVMVRVFREVRRVLRKDGTCWINYGDCYATSPNGRSAADTKAAGNDDRTFRDKPFSTIQGNMKPKDLCMAPNRLAIALQDDGWYVRSEIIWHKSNPMPESIKDRPATSHEKVWLLSRSPKYFYDADAVRVQSTESTQQRLSQDIDNQVGSTRAHAGGKTNGNMKAVCKSASFKRPDSKRSVAHVGQANGTHRPDREDVDYSGSRNLRNVWTVATKPFPEAHFATFPPDLIVPCIKAGCPQDGVVLDPFGGAGTTALVADRLQRDCILIELNAEYAELARRRISDDGGMFTAMEEAQ